MTIVAFLAAILLAAPPAEASPAAALDALLAADRAFSALASERGPVPAGQPAAMPYFTVSRRAAPGAPWRYVAEKRRP